MVDLLTLSKRLFKSEQSLLLGLQRKHGGFKSFKCSLEFILRQCKIPTLESAAAGAKDIALILRKVILKH